MSDKQTDTHNEDLIALLPWYVNNTLDKRQRERINKLLSHSAEARIKLAEIESAYEGIVNFSIPEEKTTQFTQFNEDVVANFESNVSNQSQQDVGNSAKTNKKAGFLDWLTNWSWPVPALAVTVCILLMVWVIVPQNVVTSDLDQLYAKTDFQIMDTKLQGFVMPWEQEGLSFIKTTPTLAEQAFGAGLLNGKSFLMNKKVPSIEHFTAPNNTDWRLTRWALYFDYGRWSLISWLLVENESSQQSWELQERIARDFLEKFNNLSKEDEKTVVAVRSLEKLLSMLTSLKNKQEETPRKLAALKRQLMLVIQQLGPKYLP